MQDKKTIWVWVGVVVVAAGVALAFVWPHSKSSSSATVTGTTPSQNPAPTYAASGTIVSGFPLGLVLNISPTSTMGSSYSIAYSSNTNQSTANFNSTSSMQAEYIAYKKALSDGGWIITNDINKNASSRGLYASSKSSDVVVVIVPKGKGSQVTVTYVTK